MFVPFLALVVSLLCSPPARAEDVDNAPVEGWQPLTTDQEGKDGQDSEASLSFEPAPPPSLSAGSHMEQELQQDQQQPVGQATEQSTSPEPRRRGPTMEELLLRVDQKRFDIPVTYNRDVIRWMEWFYGPGRGTFSRWLARSGRYKEMIQRELIVAKMPTDLLYLSMIESGFTPTAVSHADAVGLWQFIESTGRHYGLQIDAYVDERRDPLKATGAAIRYLRKLKNDFGNWHMAFAAYNAGEGLIFSCIRNHGTIDYWGLGQRGALPEETRQYVPKLIAAATMARNAELFGFGGVAPLAPLDLETVNAKANIRVSELAASAGISVEEFREYNPHLVGDALPPEPAEHTVYVPAGLGSTFYASINRAPSQMGSLGRKIEVAPEPEPDLSHHVKRFEPAQTAAAQAAPAAGTWTSYQVRGGESLATIARRYGCTEAELRGWNGLEPGARVEPGRVIWLQARK